MTNEKFIKKWEKTRKLGKVKYVLLNYSASALGLIIGAVICKYLLHFEFQPDNFLLLLIGTLVGCIIGGTKGWDSKEEKYQTIIKET